MEIKAAFVYEYARELATAFPAKLDQIIKSNRNMIRDRPKGPVDFGKLLRDHLPEFVRVSKDRFPGNPWQKLPLELRTRLVEATKMIYPDDHYWSGAFAEIRDISGETSLWIHQPFADNEYFWQTPLGLRIKFDKPDASIIAAFTEWLPKERRRLGLPDVKYKPISGRGIYSDRLNGLGALRLVNYCGNNPRKLTDYTGPKLKYDGVFQSVRSIRDAAKKAEELLKSLS